MLNNIPVIGWILDLIVKTSLALPFWLVWTIAGIGGKFFYFLPDVYLTPGFWECVGVFVVTGILKGFVPTLVSSSSETKTETESETESETER